MNVSADPAALGGWLVRILILAVVGLVAKGLLLG